ALHTKLKLKHVFACSQLDQLAHFIVKQHDSTAVKLLNKAAEADYYPLSAAQASVWHQCQLLQDSSIYNMPLQLTLTGALDYTAFDRAVRALFIRQQILRTVYIKVNDEVFQKINSLSAELWCKVDLSMLAEEPQYQALNELQQEHASFQFDLANDLMLQLKLVRLSDQQHCLLLNLHHIAGDGWSVKLLLQHLADFYNSECNGITLDVIDPTALQYVDYAVSQKQTEAAQHSEFWLQQLQDAPALHSVPTDYPRPVTPSYGGAVCRLELAVPLAKSLQQLANDYHCSSFNLYHSVFASLIARLSNERKVVTAVALANREQAELTEMLGFFVNTVVVVHDIDLSTSFVAQMQRSQQHLAQLLSHNINFEQLVELINPVRTLSHHPLFQLMFNYVGVDLQATEQWQQLNIQLQEAELNKAKFDLSLTVAEQVDGRVVLELEYATDLFKTATIERMLNSYKQALETLLQQPKAAQSVVSLDTEGSIGRSVPAEQLLLCQQSLIETFDYWVQKTPAKIAIKYQQQQLTYAEVGLAVDSLAAQLQQKGITKSDRVALLLPRSVELIITLLAINKVGAVYVPLDPEAPTSRNSFILEDSQASILLTESSLVKQLSNLALPILLLEQLTPTEKAFVRTAHQPDDLAYIMYTSGSTGQPKGVAVPQQAILRLVKLADYIALDQNTVFLQAGSIAFDAATLEIWGPLLNGGTLVLYPDAIITTSGIEQAVTAYNVNSLWLTAAVFENLALHSNQVLPSLRYLLTGGDVVSAKAVAAMYKRQPELNIINGYGPTENTTFTLCYPIPRDFSATTVPLGQPILGDEVIVRDHYGSVQPIGAIGELYCRGLGLAQGYWQQDALTRKMFVQFENSDQASRWYRTGDLVYRCNLGLIHFVGRADQQLKIRGFRIELGEVEHQLLNCTDVRQAVVVSRINRLQQKELVAYLVTNNIKPGQDIIRAELASKVPSYMIPAHFVILDALPITTNGKVDRRALPPVADLSSTQVMPVTETEQQLQLLWAEALDIDAAELCVETNFFALGGHSLLAGKLLSRINQQWQLALTLRNLFEHSCIRELSAFIDAKPVQQQELIVRATRQQRNPVSPAQKRLWFVCQFAQAGASYLIPTQFAIQGELKPKLLCQAIDLLVERHEILRSQYCQDDNSELYMQITAASAGVCRFTDLSESTHEQRQQQLNKIKQLNASKLFDLSKDLMIRADLVQLESQRFELLLCLHHIAADGWSMDLLYAELSELYQQLLQGSQPKSDQNVLQYLDYTHYLQQEEQQQKLSQQQVYWCQLLQDLPQVHNLPLDYPRPAEQRFVGSAVTTVFSRELTIELQRFARTQNTTPFVVLQTIFALTLARFSAETDIVIGSPVANRQRPETEPMLGLFVNSLLFRTKVDTSLALTSLLAQQQQQAENSFTRQDLPFEQLVELLNPDRSLSYHPLFQVLFNYLDKAWAEPSLTLAHNQVDILHSDELVAKFDLSLTAAEQRNGSLLFELEYDTALFKRQSVAGILACFSGYVSALLKQPEQSVQQLWLTEAASINVPVQSSG
ncbi:amino acid adenylation domain-containing protein, partial [Rheinheimera sp. WS51]|uniref:amino acid adenylation domain-containing protein n=1 Tax=Rheinheimera sp. WS51 TaxID=3425886 RepID=UPI003D92A4B3